jgi:hypothetical protein
MKISKRPAFPVFALSGISLALLSASAQAFTFGDGDFRGAFNTTLSVGGSWRMEGADNRFIAPGNINQTGLIPGSAPAAYQGVASASTGDDGNLNFGNGDMFSFVFKGLSDLDLSYKQVGLFTRFKYWYDYALEEWDVPHGNFPNGYVPDTPLSDSGMPELNKFSGIALLDLYFYTSFDVGSMPIDLRIGRQVVNWGESTFIQNGISVINPIDITALRRPGAELKEALLPVGMVFASVGLTNNLTMEAFYQFEWARTVADSCGTLFSTADPIIEGCDAITAFNSLTDQEMIGQVDFGPFNIPGSIYRNDGDDQEPSDTGQFGVSFKYYAEQLNATEFGFYFINYHSRLPFLGAVMGNTSVDDSLLGAPLLNSTAGQATYVLQFPEDIQLYGLSMNTNIGGWSVGGEISYRPNMPIDINTTETLQAIALGNQAPWSTQLDRARAAGAGGTVDGYDEYGYTQVQFTLIKQFFQVMGAGSFSLVAEFGGNYIDGLDDDQNYGRSAIWGKGDFEPLDNGQTCSEPSPLGIRPNSVAENCTSRGYHTDYAWGYRLRGVWKYSSVFAGINLTPQIAWSHDVEGYSPFGFLQAGKALGISLAGDYNSRYTFDIGYTAFFDGDYSVISDRDFLSASIGVSF